MISKFLTIAVVCSALTSAAAGNVRVLTTTSDLMSIVKEVGGERVEVSSYCKGTQDTHFLEARPSFIVNTSKADLVVSVGLGLEVGWLPKVLAGGRNPKVMEGGPGFLEVGSKVEVLEVPKGPISRAEGDVHPEGNPHVTLDPIRAGQIAVVIGQRLATLDPGFSEQYRKRAEAMQARLVSMTKIWQDRINKSGIKKVITHHKSLSYFFARFGIESAGMLEPLPGVPPTAGHLVQVIKEAARNGVKLILVENYFSDGAARKVASQVPGISVDSIPVAVLGTPGVKTLDALYEDLVQRFENAAKKVM